MSTTWKNGETGGSAVLGALAAAGVRTATLRAADHESGVLVSYDPEGASAAVAARSTVAVSAADVGRSVVVALEEGDSSRPIILGVIREALPEPEAHPAAPARPPEVSVDGRRVCLDAEEEVVLRCGEASISLRKDGRITIRGMEIVSRARGTHKVKGATVLIN